MSREIYQMTGFAITFSPSWSVAVEMRCKATGQGYVVTKALPKMSKPQAFIAFVRIGSELVRLGNAENVPGWEWGLADSKVEVRWPVYVVRKVSCPCCGNASSHDFWVSDSEAKNDSFGGVS